MIFVKMEPFKSLRATFEGTNLAAREAILAHKADKKTIKKLVVLIEGTDDKPVYSVFLDEEKVDFRDCNGCLNVEKQHNTLRDELKAKFISILDSDFKRLGTMPRHDDNLFYTDYHDSEMQMLSNPNVMKTVFKKITNKQLYEDIVLLAEKELYNLSMLKWYNIKRNLRYRFENMDIVNMFIGSELSVNTVLQYITHTGKSPKNFPKHSFDEFLIKNSLKADKSRLHHLTNGHDLVFRLSGIMKYKYSHQISGCKLRNTICQSFTHGLAKKSQLYQDIKKWCNKECVSILKEE